MMENIFCVYFHVNPVKNEIFYVGKGLRKRVSELHGRNKYWRNTVKKYGFICDIIDDSVSEEVAFEKEKFYIQKIGRSDLGLGPLVNMTDGGEGVSGRIVSPQTKKKMSERSVGHGNNNYGKTTSEDVRRKMSLAKKGKHNHSQSEATKIKLSLLRVGLKNTEESKLKASIAMKGRKNTWLVGNKNRLKKSHSEETKNKIRESLRGNIPWNKGKKKQ